MEKEKLYAARWYNKQIQARSTTQDVKDLAIKQHDILTELLGDELNQPPQVEEPERPNQNELGKKLLWYPRAEITTEKMPTRGEYLNKYPIGAVVHYTSGRSLKGDSDAINTIRGGIRNGYCYFCISRDGSVFQSFPLNRWGYHAGTSSWPGLGTSLSSKLVGIEICCAGRLESNGESWFGEKYPESEIRESKAEANIQAGKYHKYTEDQEKALIELLVWLKLNNPEVFKVEYILGHDSISAPRKSDPGGSLSMTIPQLQELIKSKV